MEVEMAWIVQSLLRNKETIRCRQNIESDEFNDLMVIESKIKELHAVGFLSDIDICIIDLVADGRSLSDLEGNIGKNRVTISRTFIQICDRISYFLGGYFTDDGFLEEMKQNYKLSDEEVDKLRVHIGSRFKHKLMRSTL
jgi:hypothetical protein